VESISLLLIVSQLLPELVSLVFKSIVFVSKLLHLLGSDIGVLGCIFDSLVVVVEVGHELVKVSEHLSLLIGQREGIF